MSNTNEALNRFPGAFFLAPTVPKIAELLSSKAWLYADEAVEQVERAGEGNMNCVVRVRTSYRSFILKQSRPWVEKYPAYPAPWDRALVEAAFYEHARKIPDVGAHLPALLNFDADERLLMLEDLDLAQDYSCLYALNSPGLTASEQAQLVEFLVALHVSTRVPELRSVFANTAMRALNHEHVFDLPLRPTNGLNLNAITPGLQNLAEELARDAEYTRQVKALGDQYLDHASGQCLVHGDYFPGSWLKARGQVYVIDPEFCFFGPPEWDLGVMTAHLHICGQSQLQINDCVNRYATHATVDRTLSQKFAGVEIMRRLIGVAQLPVVFGLERKTELLKLSKVLVVGEQPA